VIKSRRIRQAAEHMAHMGDRKAAYRVFFAEGRGNEGKSPLG
jgi:hypothetical protein